MKILFRCLAVVVALILVNACSSGKNAVRVIDVGKDGTNGLSQKELARLAEIKAATKSDNNNHGLKNIIKGTQNYTVSEYLVDNPDAENPVALDYRVGGYDVLDIKVYEEEDLSRTDVRVSADGFISFPMVGRIKVDGLITSDIEKLISYKLAQGQFLIDAHVSVMVKVYKSKQFMVLGLVNAPGAYPLKAQERVIDGLSESGGLVSGQSSSEMMIIRTQHPDTKQERKIVIRIDLFALLHEGDQQSNLLLMDKDLLYLPKAEQFYLIGQIKNPGSFDYTDKKITLVEAISKAGGFTNIAARNRTRIVRVENGEEKIIVVNVNAITKSGKKAQDIRIRPGDIIIVPESYF